MALVYSASVRLSYTTRQSALPRPIGTPDNTQKRRSIRVAVVGYRRLLIRAGIENNPVNMFQVVMRLHKFLLKIIQQLRIDRRVVRPDIIRLMNNARPISQHQMRLTTARATTDSQALSASRRKADAGRPAVKFSPSCRREKPPGAAPPASDPDIYFFLPLRRTFISDPREKNLQFSMPCRRQTLRTHPIKVSAAASAISEGLRPWMAR